MMVARVIACVLLLTASAIRAQDVVAAHVLRWQTVPGAVSYAVEVARDRSFTDVVFRTETAETELKWVPPSEDQSFFFRVAGIARSGARGAYSSPRETGPILAVPRWVGAAAPSALLWRANAPMLQLEWSATERAVSHEVELTDSGGTRVLAVDGARIELRPRTLGDLRARVRALSATGRATAWSAPYVVEVSLGAPVPSAPPQGKRVSAQQGSPVRFAWHAGPARAFEVQVGRGRRLDPEVARVGVDENTTSIVLPGYGTYVWRVRAFDASGAPSEWSELTRFTYFPTVAPPVLHSPPRRAPVSVLGRASNSVRLDWRSVAGAGAPELGYQIAVGREPELADVAPINTTEPSYAFRVEELGTHFWRVRVAVDGLPLSEWSETRTFEAEADYRIRHVRAVPSDEFYDVVVEAVDAEGEALNDLVLEGSVSRGELGTFRPSGPGEYRARWRVRGGSYDRGAFVTVRGPWDVEHRERLGDTGLSLEPLWLGAKVGIRNDLAPAVAVRLQLDAVYWSDALYPSSFVAASLGLGFDGRDEAAGIPVESSLRRIPLDIIAGLRFELEPLNLYAGAGLALEAYRGVVRSDGVPNQRQFGLLGGATLRGGLELDVAYGLLFGELGYSYISPVDALLTLGGNAVTLSVGFRVAPFTR